MQRLQSIWLLHVSFLVALRHVCRVIFKNTVVMAPVSQVIWATWNPGDEVSNVFFADYNTTGPGVKGARRPTFAKVLSTSQAAAYNISSTVGSDYASWVDMTYLV